MLEKIKTWLFDPAGIDPHGFFTTWDPWLIWTHSLSDIGVGLAYFSIPVVLVRLVRTRSDLISGPLFWLIATFILLCGTEHWVDLLALWYPLYGLQAVIKSITAVVSVCTAGTILFMMPRILSIPTQKQMRIMNDALAASEERLRHAQKMESLGQLTGGVAHDFNNVLQAVRGNLEIMRRRVQAGRTDFGRLLDNALEATTRAGRLTHQLLSFARKSRLEARALDPRAVIDALLVLLQQSVNERITIEVKIADLGLVLADHSQLESALLNLVFNARDAIPGTGTIRITARSIRLDATPAGPPAGEYVRIAVQDTGTGMTEEVKLRAFEPFFTTKEHGKGTGLGLAQIYGFVHQSGGTVTVDSTPGIGTEVAIILPRGDVPAAADQPQNNALRRGSNEIVLIVEDDALVRSSLAETLLDIGYQVVEAHDADDALIQINAGLTPAVILSDLSMPGSLNGKEFATLIRSRLPAVPVIITTGHASPAVLPVGVSYIQKPFAAEDISAAIRAAVASLATA